MITGSTKYTNRDVERVRNLYEQGYSTTQVASMCGVPSGTLRVAQSTLGRSLSRRPTGAGKRSRNLTQPGRVEQDRQLVRLVKVDGLPPACAGRVVGLLPSTACDRYGRSLYCRALRQYVYGEDCGLPSGLGHGRTTARAHLAERGIPPHLVDSLLPIGGDDDDE